jgi:hypothetical protein
MVTGISTSGGNKMVISALASEISQFFSAYRL